MEIKLSLTHFAVRGKHLQQTQVRYNLVPTDGFNPALLTTDGSSKGPGFYFAGRPVHWPQHNVFYRYDQPDPSVREESIPAIGYLNYTNVSGPRWHKCQPRQHSRGDDSARLRVSKEKHARVIPKEWTEDPYFVCVLLSLAQRQEYRLKPPKPASYLVSVPCLSNCDRSPRFVFPAHIPQSRLLVVSPLDREFFHLYEAQITSNFLGMLDNPTTATMETNFPVIKHRKIPFEPFETFQERILADLSINHTPPKKDDDTTNDKAKRAHDHEDDEECKRGRTS